MLFYCPEVSPWDIELYHKEGYKQDNIKSRPGFQELREDVKRNGILDPVLCIQYPGLVQIEIGEQRLLLARELGIESLRCFIRSKGNQVRSYWTKAITSSDQVLPYFREETIPTYLSIMRYISGGVIQL